MFLFEVLGFQGVVYVFLLVGFLVARCMWRNNNGEDRKEEIFRLVDSGMASSHEGGLVEMEASSVESSFGKGSNGFQCVVCYSPTTMRCSKCKAVRYWFVFFLKVSCF